MYGYTIVQETAKLWGVPELQIQKLCKANCVEGVIHLNRVWLIPRNTEKPADMRRKNYKEMGI